MDTVLGLAVVIPLIDDEGSRPKVCPRTWTIVEMLRTSYVSACAGESDRPCHSIVKLRVYW
jgi:hypothetical protein